MGWTERWMDLANLIASWSKDRSRKVGCVIVDERQTVVSLGWNGFPRGVDDNVGVRHERPAKYLWTHHAEANAIDNAAANGRACKHCTMYLTWYPCASCARHIIQAGIRHLVCVEPDWEDISFSSDFHASRSMLREAGVSTFYVSDRRPPERKDRIRNEPIEVT